MNIPDKVRIGSVDYKVEVSEVPLILNCRQSLGIIDYNLHSIKLDDTVQDKQGIELSFLHELFHGMVRERGIELENEEEVVDELAISLHQIIRDNQEIFISKERK